MSDNQVPPSNPDPAPEVPQQPAPWAQQGQPQQGQQPTGQQPQWGQPQQGQQPQWGQPAQPQQTGQQPQWGQAPQGQQPQWGQAPQGQQPTGQQPQWGQQPAQPQQPQWGQQGQTGQQPQWGQGQPQQTGQQPQWGQQPQQPAAPRQPQQGQPQWGQTAPQQPVQPPQQWGGQQAAQPTAPQQWGGQQAQQLAAPQSDWSYGTPAPQQTGAYAPAGAPPVPPKRKSRLPLILGLSGGGVVVIAAIIAVVALVLPGILAPSSGSAGLVADLNSEPKAKWKADYTLGDDKDTISDVTVVQVGDVAIIVPQFDEDSYDGGDSDWYPGYDDDYAKGYAAGVQYRAAEDAYINDFSFTVPYPSYNDYWPGSSSFSDVTASDWKGVYDGFSDGMDGSPQGTSQAQKPADPDFTPKVAGFSMSTGKELWTLDIAKQVKGADFESSVSVSPIDTSHIIVTTNVYDDKNGISSALLSVNPATGKVGAEKDVDGYASARGNDGATYTLTQTAKDSPVELARYKGAAIDGKPVWSEKVDEKTSSLAFIGSDYVGVQAVDYQAGDGSSDSSYSFDISGEVFEAATGKKATWGDDIDENTSYLPLGDKVLRAESDKKGDSNKLMAIDPKTGKDNWSSSVTADRFWTVDGGLFTADKAGDSDYDGLTRLDPATGKAKWGSDTWDGTFQYVDAIVGDSLIVEGEKDVFVLKASDGKEGYEQRVGKTSSVYVGQNQFYVAEDGDLAAHKYSAKGEVWSYDLDDSESIRQVGESLVVIDTDAGTASLLAS